MDNIKKIKRTAKLVSVLSKYGFETLVSQTGIRKLIPESYIEHSEKRKEVFSLTIYERIRLVLEELGPAYIKLGQLLSNRDDILPGELTSELQKLQDQVNIKDINIRQVLHEELLLNPDTVFEDIDPTPIAAASLSQVYTARLKENGQKIIIKAKKKGILDTIKADILIMKDFSNILERYYDAAQKIGLSNIVNTFEKSIIAELSFIQELANMERFRKNFAGNEDIYIPETFKELSTSNILCMEYIDGIKISDKNTLLEKGLDIEKVAGTVVDSYLKQVIDYGFFHADPHSGNIFVLETGKIVYIDYGSMGRLHPRDKEFVGDFVMYALRKDTKRLVRIIKKIAVKYSIPNEIQFERDLYDLLDILDSNSIKDLDLNDLIKRFGRLLNENHVILPEYVYLLIRGIVLLEGIGRELGIESNIIENIKPYGIKLVKQKISTKYLQNKIIDKLYDLGDRFNELPDDIQTLVQKVNNDELEINHKIKGLADIKNTLNCLAISMLVAALAVGSAIIIHAEMPPTAWGVSVFGVLGFILAGALATITIIVILKNSR